MVALLKRLHKGDVGKSSNALAYSKFLARTMAQLGTFDKESESYVDYAARDMERSKKATAARQLNKQAKQGKQAPKSAADKDESEEEEEEERQEKKAVVAPKEAGKQKKKRKEAPIAEREKKAPGKQLTKKAKKG